jgi:hypothetical protein
MLLEYFVAIRLYYQLYDEYSIRQKICFTKVRQVKYSIQEY